MTGLHELSQLLRSLTHAVEIVPSLADVPIDVSKIVLPTYFVSAIEDHIAPWKTTYAGPRLLGGKSRFVLSGSGHIAGMVNPPAANKYGYWTNPALPDDADAAEVKDRLVEAFVGTHQEDDVCLLVARRALPTS